jgi:hypothetical protein
MTSRIERTFFCNVPNLGDYMRWQNKLLTSFVRLQENFAPHVASYIRDLIRPEPKIFLIQISNAIVYTHRWGNGEIKSIVSPFVPLSKEDQFWAEQYPFIEKDEDLTDVKKYGAISYSIKKNNLSEIQVVTIPSGTNASLISHVNHYGHFVLDSLPLHLLVHRYFGHAKIYGLDTGVNSEILEEYNYVMRCITRENIMGTISQLPDVFRVSRALVAQPSSPLVSLFLLREIKNLIRKDFTINTEESLVGKISTLSYGSRQRLFVTRGGRSASRIYNYSEVTRKLIECGFCPVDIGKLTIPEMVALFRNAKEIVAECGTASHLSAFFSDDIARMYCLIPRRLLYEADASSLFGCLSYYCGYLHRVHFVFGDSVTRHRTPTSDSSNYNIDTIVRAISGEHLDVID